MEGRDDKDKGSETEGEITEGRTCLSSYPEFKMIGGSNKLKNRVCLNDYHQLNQTPSAGPFHASLLAS